MALVDPAVYQSPLEFYSICSSHFIQTFLRTVKALSELRRLLPRTVRAESNSGAASAKPRRRTRLLSARWLSPEEAAMSATRWDRSASQDGVAR